jgi:hypothetical protein
MARTTTLEQEHPKMTRKLEANDYAIREFFKLKHLDTENEGLHEDCAIACGDALNAAENAETVRVVLDDWLESRPHLNQHIVVPDEAAEPALTSLKLQAELVKKYGEGPARAKIESIGGRLGSILKPTTPKQIKAAAKAETEKTAPSRNPWHSAWPKNQDRDAAKAAIFKTGGTKFAASLARAAGVELLSGKPLKS